MRRSKCAKRADDSAQLGELTIPGRSERILREYRVSAEARVSEILDTVPSAVRSVCLHVHEDAWLFGVDPTLW